MMNMFFDADPFSRLTKFWVSLSLKRRITKQHREKSSNNVKMLNININVSIHPNVHLCSTPKYQTLAITHLRRCSNLQHFFQLVFFFKSVLFANSFMCPSPPGGRRVFPQSVCTLKCNTFSDTFIVALRKSAITRSPVERILIPRCRLD